MLTASDCARTALMKKDSFGNSSWVSRNSTNVLSNRDIIDECSKYLLKLMTYNNQLDDLEDPLDDVLDGEEIGDQVDDG